MKSQLIKAVWVAGLAWSSLSFAQIRVGVDVALPSIRFEAPPPVVVAAPGVQVIEGQDEEVFFSDGYYWHRRGEHWFRARNNWAWEPVEVRHVPQAVVTLPPGRYRNFHREPDRHDMKVREAAYRGKDRREEHREIRHEERHEERREEKREEKHQGKKH